MTDRKQVLSDKSRIDEGSIYDPIEIKVQRKTRNSWLGLRKKNKTDKLDPLDVTGPPAEVTFRELLKLNLPDWYLVVLGILASGIFGALFPIISILFSDILQVRKELMHCIKLICRTLNGSLFFHLITDI